MPNKEKKNKIRKKENIKKEIEIKFYSLVTFKYKKLFMIQTIRPPIKDDVRFTHL